MSEYVPFGDEWQKHVAKLPKRELVKMLAKALREKQEVQLELFYVQKSAQQGVQPTLESGRKSPAKKSNRKVTKPTVGG